MITIPTILITCFVGCLYDKITAYISILGGFCSVVIAFLMPGLLYLKTCNKPLTSCKSMTVLLLITTFCLIGYTAGIITIVHIFTG